jgi:hypothetical protein
MGTITIGAPVIDHADRCLSGPSHLDLVGPVHLSLITSINISVPFLRGSVMSDGDESGRSGRGKLAGVSTISLALVVILGFAYLGAVSTGLITPATYNSRSFGGRVDHPPGCLIDTDAVRDQGPRCRT